jgi:asparagine synthase (glutamine-hydrolysing)
MQCSIGAEEALKKRRHTVSVQFGRWNFDGRPADTEYLAKAEGMVAPYGPDGGGMYIKDGVGILFRAFHTTKESWSEAQPYITHSSVVITWDGRLDNRAEIIRELRDIQTTASTDVSIVAASYERWGTGCFAKLIGDWALSIWNPKDRSLILAKDPIGTRHLYYSLDKDQVSWSSILDPLVLLAGKAFALDEEYIAGWLSFFPATHLTPYVGIRSVPQSASVLIRAGKRMVSKYWDFDPGRRICYRSDGEYEEHFRAVFRESVRRRLRSDSPILAELSGGMDSSSIVCMADTIIARGAAETPLLDTVSYYDDSEPNWNERPYFTKVEEKRGRTGCHIDVSPQESFQLELQNDRFPSTPASAGSASKSAKQFAALMASQSNRVLLSGVGGDEITGGVPTPIPELEDLLAAVQFKTFVRRLKTWALTRKKPWFQLVFEAAQGFLPPALVRVPDFKRPAPWLNPDFVKRNRAALQGYAGRLKLFGLRPSFQENVSILKTLQRYLASCSLPFEPLYEKRYPYLDRGLLEFICAIPREQLVRPGQRRSLMRRALTGIVPQELLNRKRKAFLDRGPRALLARRWAGLSEIGGHLVSESLGIVRAEGFCEALQAAREGREAPIVPLQRTLLVEAWLSGLSEWGPLGIAKGKAKSTRGTPLVVGTQSTLLSKQKTFLSAEETP